DGVQALLELASQNGVDAELPQVLGVYRRVQTVRAKVGGRIDLLDPRDDGGGEPRRRMHRQVERDECRAAETTLVELHDRQIAALDGRARLPQPCGRRREAERLPAKLVGW